MSSGSVVCRGFVGCWWCWVVFGMVDLVLRAEE